MLVFNGISSLLFTRRRFCYLAVVFNCLIQFSHSFDMKLDNDQDRTLWKFKGRYLYTQNGDDLQDLLNSGGSGGGSSFSTYSSNRRFSSFSTTTSSTTSSRTRIAKAFKLPQNESFRNSTRFLNGIWFTKHVSNRPNTLSFTTVLRHQLFKQGWVTFFATPNVEVKVKTNQGQQISSFWNNGKNWCDALISMGLKTTFTLEVDTTEPDSYFLLDKVVLGVMTNITGLGSRPLNPCLTSPYVPTDDSVEEDETEDEEMNILEKETTTVIPTLSRQSREFDPRVEISNIREAEPTNYNNASKLEMTNTTSMELSTVSPNRQNRSSFSSVANESYQNQSSNSSRNLLSASTLQENPALQIDLPIGGSLFQSLKNLKEPDSTNLKCSCTCKLEEKE